VELERGKKKCFHRAPDPRKTAPGARGFSAALEAGPGVSQPSGKKKGCSWARPPISGARSGKRQLSGLRPKLFFFFFFFFLKE